MAWKRVSTDWSNIDILSVIKLDSPETVHFDVKHWTKHVCLLVLIAKSKLNQFASVLQVNNSSKMSELFKVKLCAIGIQCWATYA